MSDYEMDLVSGIAAFESKQFSQAMRLLSPLAESGEPEAQFRVAVMCQNGLGVVVNAGRALACMRAAAESGHALAQHGLGVMLLFGECAEKAEPEAANWFRRAADQGLVGSLSTLAMMYEQGLGVKQVADMARRLYEGAGVHTEAR